MSRATAISEAFDSLSTLILDVELECSTPEIEQRAAWIRQRLIRLGIGDLVEALDSHDNEQWALSRAELCEELRG